MLDDDGYVVPQAWTGAPFWTGGKVLFVSDEDLIDDTQLARWTADVPVVVVTRERRGARVHDAGRWREIRAFPADEVDPTGAGDVFAAAFLVRLSESGDVPDATRFASAAAACSVEAEGIEAIATREQIEDRLSRHPEVVLT
jgi:sugar/nucleoside kinase (ribokinase family)